MEWIWSRKLLFFFFFRAEAIVRFQRSGAFPLHMMGVLQASSWHSNTTEEIGLLACVQMIYMYLSLFMNVHKIQMSRKSEASSIFVSLSIAKTHRVVLRENNARAFNSFQLHMRIFLTQSLFSSEEQFTQALQPLDWQQWTRTHRSHFSWHYEHLCLEMWQSWKKHMYLDTQNLSVLRYCGKH